MAKWVLVAMGVGGAGGSGVGVAFLKRNSLWMTEFKMDLGLKIRKTYSRDR
jgi:hypothetical protein